LLLKTQTQSRAPSSSASRQATAIPATTGFESLEEDGVEAEGDAGVALLDDMGAAGVPGGERAEGVAGAAGGGAEGGVGTAGVDGGDRAGGGGDDDEEELDGEGGGGAAAVGGGAVALAGAPGVEAGGGDDDIASWGSHPRVLGVWWLVVVVGMGAEGIGNGKRREACAYGDRKIGRQECESSRLQLQLQLLAVAGAAGGAVAGEAGPDRTRREY